MVFINSSNPSLGQSRTLSSEQDFKMEARGATNVTFHFSWMSDFPPCEFEVSIDSVHNIQIKLHTITSGDFQQVLLSSINYNYNIYLYNLVRLGFFSD